MARTGPRPRSIFERYSGGSSRPSLRTARLITDQVTSTSRTCSTSISQREVSHAHGQIGSNHISTAALTVISVILPADGHRRRPVQGPPPPTTGQGPPPPTTGQGPA